MERAGADVPALKARPDVFGLEWIWEGFWELSTCRSIGFAAGPIPWTAKHDYCVHMEFDCFERELFMRCLRSMDNEYMAKQRRDGRSSNKTKRSNRAGSRQSR